MPELVRSVTLDAPASVTWRALTDWSAQGNWMPATVVSVDAAAPDKPTTGVGTRLSARTGFGQFAFVDAMRITRWDPPYRCEVVHLGKVVRGFGAFEVRPLPGERSELVWAEWLELPLGVVGRWAWRIARPALVRGIDLALRRFAAWAPTYAGAAT